MSIIPPDGMDVDTELSQGASRETEPNVSAPAAAAGEEGPALKRPRAEASPA